MFATEHYVFNRQMCRCYRSGVVYFGTARRDSFGSGQGGRDCAAKEREDDKTTGPPGATNPQAATGRPHLADDREGVRGHHRAGHYRPGERRPGDILCPLRRQGDAPGQPARGPTGHAGAATTTSTYDAGRTTRARSEEHTSELQSQSNLVCRLLLEKKHYFTLTNYPPRVAPSWATPSHRRTPDAPLPPRRLGGPVIPDCPVYIAFFTAPAHPLPTDS